ncbi:hypothetical protein EB796_013872 [Bugula neritina]|uniref:G-protein coupled receptors family 2 profile 2 domain-containing protein n=1 Tax=Bugula neritina TaxID=10212 RepID=A0A7J7JND4_BUGNE|nr:hypothetical protein EB796_013872 [Bugula neritina]
MSIHNASITLKCRIKQYLPPLELVDSVRRCKFDAANYVASCPKHAKHWKISEMCSSGPASFVYDGGKLRNLVDKSYSLPVKSIGTGYGTSILSYGQKNKYRNSYCASCNGVAWLGCKAKPNVIVTGTSEYAFDRWLRYEKDVMKFLFIYEIDLNERTCNMNSDAVLLYSDFNTTLDTCLNISHNLKQCNCSSILDLDSETCIPTPFVNDKCRENRYEPETFKVTNHGVMHCENNFEYLPLSTRSAVDECDKCFINARSDNCQSKYEQFTGSPNVVVNSVNSVHCAANDLIRCNVFGIEDSYCTSRMFVSGSSSATSKFQFSIILNISLPNSVAISYEPSKFNFQVQLEKLASLGLELLFSTFNNDSLNSQCVEYSLTSNQTSWLICRNGELQRTSDQTHYGDYLLWNDEIRVCTETAVPEFVLPTHDRVFYLTHEYVFSSFSIFFVLIYVIYYFTKSKRTLTGDFVVSSMITVMCAILFYCLIKKKYSFISCRVIASSGQYFFIALHTWTNAIGILMIKGISSFKLASQSSRKKYAYYAAYAWLTPLIFVIIAYSVDAAKPHNLYPVFSDQFCFIPRGRIRLLLVTGPIYLLVVVNITMCIIASVIVAKSGNKIAIDDKQRTLKKVITIVKLQVIFGLEWFLLLFTEIKGPHQTGLWIALNVLGTSQGVLAVLAQLITSANIRNFLKWFNSKIRNPNPKNSQIA